MNKHTRVAALLTVNGVINLSITEHSLIVTDVFSGTFIPDDEVKKKRLPIPADSLLAIQQECMALDDEPRWLIALISDTGMRLSEACGLQACDIHLDGDTPYIDLVEHPWRRLKTSSSSSQTGTGGFLLDSRTKATHTSSDEVWS